MVIYPGPPIQEIKCFRRGAPIRVPPEFYSDKEYMEKLKQFRKFYKTLDVFLRLNVGSIVPEGMTTDV